MSNSLIYIGRKQELNRLSPLLQKNSASLVIFKGRRRIGKSRLAEEFAKNSKNYRFLKFAGLAPTEKISPQEQRQEFMRLLSAQTAFPEVSVDDWGKAFSSLASQTQTGRVIILLDEISWMAKDSPEFLPKLKNAWDLNFKNNPELILILCSSISSWMDENIIESTGFMGRISLTLSLEPLPLKDCSTFIKTISPNLSPQEQLQILAITGGIPRYLEEILPHAPALETIRALCFKKEGILFREFEDIFTDLFSKKSPTYVRILMALLEGKTQFQSLCETLELSASGSVSEYLTHLVQAGFIQKDFTWNIKTQNTSRFSHYRISDNYVRFYLKFVLPNKTKIENGLFEQKSLPSLPNWEGIMGLQFENLVLQNRSLIWEALNLNPNYISIENPFFQKPSTRNPGCQIDYLIQTQYHTLFPCEIKFTQSKPLGPAVIQQMKEKLDKLTLPKNFSYWPVLIHANEISDGVSHAGYFSKIINFCDFLN